MATPPAERVAAETSRTGAWALALDARVFALWINEPTFKGGSGAGSTNWFSLGATRRSTRTALALRVMGSLETVTWGDCGYPRVLAAGAACSVDGFREYQPPHPPLMQASARWEHEAGESVVGLTLGLVGEPALGPPMYVHRASAAFDPVAPITHHEMNPAHASAGVLTASLAERTWKFEASVFNGEPADPDRVLPRYHGLRSASARLTLAPVSGWSVQTSLGRVRSRQAHHAGAGASVDLLMASAAHEWSGRAGNGAATLAWARMDDGALVRHSVMIEGTLTVAGRHTAFARAEAAHRPDTRGADIVETGDGEHEHFVVTARAGVAQFSVGVATEYRLMGAAVGIGARGSVSLLPTALSALYGERRPAGFSVFASLRPAAGSGHASH